MSVNNFLFISSPFPKKDFNNNEIKIKNQDKILIIEENWSKITYVTAEIVF